MDSSNNIEPFRILSLDGGGIKGTYTASVLAALERATGKRVAEQFDLIVGTSTGGIIALALGLGLPACEILRFYQEKGPAIFRAGHGASVKHLFSVKFNAKALLSALEEVFGKKLLGHSRVRLVIPAFDTQRGSIHLFKTSHDLKYMNDHRLLATTVGMSTAAAPTYFSAHTTSEDNCYLDGGVWANCPALVGILEAMCVLKKPLDTIRVLSIGTTNEPYSIDKSLREAGGQWDWKKDVLPLFMQAQVKATLGKCELLINDRFVRIDNTVERGRFTLDRASDVPELRALGEQAARVNGPKVAASFFFDEACVFEPIHRNN